MNVVTAIKGAAFAWLDSKRAASNFVQFAPPHAPTFRGGLGGQQPTARTLLRECKGIAASAQRAISNRLSSLELQVKVKRRDARGRVVKDPLEDMSHPLVQMLDDPHPNFSISMFQRIWGDWLGCVGEAYTLKIRNGLRVPRNLQPMPPGALAPMVSQGIVTHYMVTHGDGSQHPIKSDCVIRAYFPDPESLHESEGILGPTGIDVDADKFAGEHLRSHYQHNAIPHVVLKPDEDPQKMDKDAKRRFYEDWVQNYHQREGTRMGLPGLLPMNWGLIELAMDSGADIVPLLTHWRDAILMAYGTPKSILGLVESGDRSSAETNQFVFDLHTITPFARVIQDALTRDLARDFDPKLVIEFKEFVSRDKEHELKKRRQRLELKETWINEVREEDGLDDVDWGDLPVGTFADAPYDPERRYTLAEDNAQALDVRQSGNRPQRAEPTPERVVTPEMRDVWARQLLFERKYVPLFEKALKRVFKAQRIETLRQLYENEPRVRVSTKQIFDVDKWLNRFFANTEPVRLTAFADIAALTIAALSDNTFSFGDAQRQLLEDQGAAMVQHINAITEERINAQLLAGVEKGESVDQVAARIRSVFDERSKNQARTIARTEMLSASQSAQLEGFKQSGVVRKKTWNTSLDGRVRDSHALLEGVTVALEESFTLVSENGVEEASAPGVGVNGGELSASERINCRCFMTTASFLEE